MPWTTKLNSKLDSMSEIWYTVSPVGSSTDYTNNFSIQSGSFSASSARVSISQDELFELRERDKPQAVIDLMKKQFEEDTSAKSDSDSNDDTK